MLHLFAGCEVESEPRTPAIELENLLNRLERVTTRLEHTVGVAAETEFFKQQTSEQPIQLQPPPPPPLPPPLPPDLLVPEGKQENIMSVAAFNNILQGPLAQFLQLSAKIGGDVATHSKLVEKAFQ